MSGFSRFILAIGLCGAGAGFSSLKAAEPALLPAFPDFPAFTAAPAGQASEDNKRAQASLAATLSKVRAASQAGQEPLAPEANIQAAGGPVKAAVLPGLIGLGYKVATDTTYSTVLTKLSGSRLSTIRLTVTFASIGTHTRVIVDMRRTAPGTSETESALDHPDRNAIQARLLQVKTQVEARAVAPPPPVQASGAPVPLGQPSPLTPATPAPVVSQPPPAQAASNPQSLAPQPLAPLGAPTAIAPAPAVSAATPQAAETEPAAATPSWLPQFPRLGFPAPGGQSEPAQQPAATPPVQQAAPAEPPPAPAEQRPLARQRANPLSEWLPNLPPPNLPNLFPSQSDAPPDDRPLRKGQTRVRL